MKESVYSNGLVKMLRSRLPGSVVFKHADALTAGIPDISVTWNGRTTWLEVKVGRIVGRGVQALTIQRLALAGRCWYVVYSGKSVVTIVDPLGNVVVNGTGHETVVAWIRSQS